MVGELTYDRIRACSRKRQFEREADAKKAAKKMQPSGGYYACMHCGHYHLTRQRQQRPDRIAEASIHDPRTLLSGADRTTAPKMKEVKPNELDLTGIQYGAFTVKGLSAEAKGRWVVQCNCGTFSVRSAKAIRNPANCEDKCNRCRRYAYLRSKTGNAEYCTPINNHEQ